MPPLPNRLSILTFPQRWDGQHLDMRVLVIPKGDPLEPLVKGATPALDAPAFARAQLALNALLIPGLVKLPDPADAVAPLDLGIAPPADAEALFQALAAHFNIVSTLPKGDPRPKNTFIKKYLPTSYRSAFAFEQPRTIYAVTDESYHCALHAPRPPAPPKPPPTDEVSWGKVIALMLRQPRIAEELGLLYKGTITPPAGLLEQGGWVYATLAPASHYFGELAVDPTLVRVYAARLPDLAGDERPLLASVLFPVQSGPPAGSYDTLFIESEDYDDGFAKIVHCHQPDHAILMDEDPNGPAPVNDVGIRLGWEDEQITVWMNRQLTPDPAVAALDAPMGVWAYRVDVRHAGESDWNSLCRVRGPVGVGALDLGIWEGEPGVQATPVQLEGRKDGDYWLPSFFAQWRDRSLVGGDALGMRLRGVAAPPAGGGPEPLGDREVRLRYGKSYEFRVRLMDLSGGGPGVKDPPVNPAPAPIARCDFRRLVPPRTVRTERVAVPTLAAPQARYKVFRPTLGYPELVLAGFPDAEAALLADLPKAKAEKRDVALSDPDVQSLQITVEVRGLGLDPAYGAGNFGVLYTALRDFPASLADPLDLVLAFEDRSDAGALQPADPLEPVPGVGPLVLPTARDVRLRLAAVGRSDPGLDYFGSHKARFGPTTDIETRCPSADETALFRPSSEQRRFQIIMLQPDPAPSATLTAQRAAAGDQDQASSDLAGRLAQHLGLEVSGLTFYGQDGRRVVFGCSPALSHTLAPDHSAITFGSKADLTGHWVAVIRLQLDRDWTWDALADTGFRVTNARTNAPVGSIEPRRTVNASAVNHPDRTSTDLVFFDAVDPKPLPGRFPQELSLEYRIEATFKEAPTIEDPALGLSARVPMAVAPAQVPRLACAGVALSSYERSADYSSTEPRARALWLEFEEPLLNSRDAYFARVLAYVPDPMLTGGRDFTLPPEPPLPIDPEPIRVITHEQPEDEAGLGAMQRLIPSTSPRHFLVPLPPGTTAQARERFGFWVYELRVGHADGWSTAQGRFGRPLRVTGVQHPAPLLTCQVGRQPEGIAASANFAVPVFEGSTVMARPPATEMWILLYAQVRQVDGADWRNVLLGRRRARPIRRRAESHFDHANPLQVAGHAAWDQGEIDHMLATLALPRDASLSTLAVELLPESDDIPDPLGGDLGHVRILRTSPLTAVPAICL